ncbi:MAG: hypothetical protein K5984_04640 [Bacteroidales bacterium]|nr:hypothetical protein [Bacteroidales bacterium]
MKKALRITLLSVLAVVTIAATALLYMGNKAARQVTTCSGKIRVEFADDYRFITERDVRTAIKKEYGTLAGVRIDSVDLAKVERIVERISAVQKGDAFVTRDGYLNVMISQREPFLRFQKGQTGFYADKSGYIFPLQDRYTLDVPLVEGNIPIQEEGRFKGRPDRESERKWLDRIIDMVSYMEDSREWKDRIVQIHVNGAEDMILVPRKGREKFIFGGPGGYQAKFARMEKYYRSIAPNYEPGYYSKVDVRVKGQVICRK